MINEYADMRQHGTHEAKEAVPEYKRYTYADYCTWGDDERWELIDGVPYAMAPAPFVGHQSVSAAVFGQLYVFLQGKPCKVLAAPIDVRLNADEGDDTVLQPDIIVVCDKSKLKDKRSVIGVPDMIVEILSPSSIRHDRVVKFKKYKHAGVREYWIIDPDSKIVSVHVLQRGEYMTHSYTEEESVPVGVLEGCTINLPEVFAE